MKTPYYDPATDKIYNASPLSKAWWHERRHKHQNKNKFIRFMNLYYNTLLTFMSTFFLIMMLIPHLRTFFIQLFILAHLLKYGLYWVLELDAVWYANKKEKEKFNFN